MKIAGNSVYTSGFSPSSQQAAADARAERRAEEQQQKNVDEGQKRKDLQSSGEPLAGVSRDESLGFRQVAATNGTNKQFALYSESDRGDLPNSQKKALQAYAETQDISRVDANIEYLGSVDIFV